jgi:hypothetical protein
MGSGHIVIDEAFINRVMTKLDELRRQITPLYDGTGGASYQNLHNLSTWAGTENFAPGKELRDAILQSGQGIETRLRTFDQTMEQFYIGLTDFLAETDNVESLNTVSADDFVRFIAPPTSTT